MNLQDIGNLTDAEKLALVKAIQENVAASKAKQVSMEAGQYAKLVVDAIKKIKSDLEDRYAAISADITVKAAAIKDGKDGLQGPKGEKGDRGFDGVNGKDGRDGKDGKDGVDGSDGNGVLDAHIDFDGSLIITLTNGHEINAGEVVPFDVAEKIKVVGNGGGTSQYVLDLIAALQAQVNAISPTLVVTDTFVVNSQSAMLALSTAEKGDIAVRTDLNKTFILTTSPYSTLSNWQELLTPTDVVTSVAGRQGAVTLSYTDISGLGTAATTNSTAYATAAQGAKADTALQSETYTGTVTSVGMTVPTGLSVSGSPVTSAGTLAVSYATGYSIPTTANQTNWSTAYGWGNHASAGYLTTSVAASTYAPLTGTGASGTWGISISGNAATATSATTAGSATTASSATTATSATNATNAANLVTTNFSIVQSGTKLLFKYGATTIASMDSTGIITSATNIISNGTP